MLMADWRTMLTDSLKNTGSVGLCHLIHFWAAAPVVDKVLKNGEIFSPSIQTSPPTAWLGGPQTRPGWEALRPGWERNRRTDGRKISPFYRTSSPTEAAALLQ